MGDYRELIFYQKAREVVKGIDDLIRTWSRTMQAQEISRQILRSAMSVGANIAEGHGRHEGAEYVHYLIIAQGSANETDHWLHTLIDIGLSSKENIQTLINMNNEVRRMLTSSIRTLRSKPSSHAFREESIPYNADIQPLDE
jgi:four helix bundle protein